LLQKPQAHHFLFRNIRAVAIGGRLKPGLFLLLRRVKVDAPATGYYGEALNGCGSISQAVFRLAGGH